MTCGSRGGGQGRGRTADLPLFRRTLVPTELPAPLRRPVTRASDVDEDTWRAPGGHIGLDPRGAEGRRLRACSHGGQGTVVLAPHACAFSRHERSGCASSDLLNSHAVQEGLVLPLQLATFGELPVAAVLDLARGPRGVQSRRNEPRGGRASHRRPAWRRCRRVGEAGGGAQHEGAVGGLFDAEAGCVLGGVAALARGPEVAGFGGAAGPVPAVRAAGRRVQSPRTESARDVGRDRQISLPDRMWQGHQS